MFSISLISYWLIPILSSSGVEVTILFFFRFKKGANLGEGWKKCPIMVVFVLIFLPILYKGGGVIWVKNVYN